MDQGLRHWSLQRLTAIGLVPLTIWFVFSLAGRRSLGFDVVTTWLHEPLVAAGLLVYCITLLYHSTLGLQSIIEDYVGDGPLKRIGMRFVVLAHLLAGLAAAAGLIRIVMVSA